MVRIQQDPTNISCPDFAGVAYAVVRQILSNNGQINNNQVIKQLMTAWNQTHTQEVEAWNLQVQADLEEQAEVARLADKDETRCCEADKHQKEDERKELEKKQPKINDFNESKIMADHVMPQPSQFTLGKLKSFSFVKLWYFTDEGCAEAQDSSRAQLDDTYGLTKVNDLVALKPVTSFKASQNVIPDTDLTWHQLKNALLCYMELCDWPWKHMESLTHFYFNIELEPMQSRPNSERVLITYQAKVRQQWHDDLARGQGFSIMPINQKLLSMIAEEVWDVVRLDAIRKVSNPSLPSFSRDTH